MRGTLPQRWGRFNSPDPGNIGADPANPQTWNAYAYVGNNPLGLIDPTGMSSCAASNNWCGLGSPGASPTSNPAAYQNFISQQMYAGGDLAYGDNEFQLMNLQATTPIGYAITAPENGVVVPVYGNNIFFDAGNSVAAPNAPSNPAPQRQGHEIVQQIRLARVTTSLQLRRLRF